MTVELMNEDEDMDYEEQPAPASALMSMLNGTAPAPVCFARSVSSDRAIEQEVSLDEEDAPPPKTKEDAPTRGNQHTGCVDLSLLGLQAYLAVPDRLPKNCDIYWVETMQPPLLNRAVRLALFRLKRSHRLLRVTRNRFEPCRNFRHIGILLHEYRISVSFSDDPDDSTIVASRINENGELVKGYGDTILIAASRCFVHSVFGEEVVLRQLPAREFVSFTD